MADSRTQLNPNFLSESSPPSPPDPMGSLSRDSVMSFGQRIISAAGAAVLSAVIVNPLDVAKTRLQAQAAGVPYQPTKNCIGGHMASRNTNLMYSDFRCSPSCTWDCVVTPEPASPLKCYQYKGTFDVLSKVARQEGYARLWRGTSASLALAIPTVLLCRIFVISLQALRLFGFLTACIVCSPIELARARMQAFRELQKGDKSSGVWKTLLGVLSPTRSTKYLQN